MQRRNFFTTAAAAAACGLVGASHGARAARFHQDGPEWFTNVEVTGHDGRVYRFYDDLLKGKIVLINFFYTDCDNVCPLATENLGYVQELLGDRVGKEIFMYSLTLQPRLDTPEKLASYARSRGVRPGWLFLTGKPDDIELLRHRLGFVDSDPAQDADLEQHLGTVRIANEPMHRWIMTPSLLNPPAIVRAVKRVIPEPA
ncbi:MAG TPA: SCO family protein [Acetobacteraceae bacterium]|nr:SCO family protein [Acetobacteraceae bacterium]